MMNRDPLPVSETEKTRYMQLRRQATSILDASPMNLTVEDQVKFNAIITEAERISAKGEAYWDWRMKTEFPEVSPTGCNP
jgi:hypothetical protein